VIVVDADDEKVKVLDSYQKKLQEIKVEYFERARLGTDTANSCIFVKYNHRC
jgi:hypothetical protein